MEAPKTTHVAGNLELPTDTQLRSGFLREFDGFDNAVRVAFPVKSPLVQAASTERSKYAIERGLEIVNLRHRSEMTHLEVIVRMMREENSNVEKAQSA